MIKCISDKSIKDTLIHGKGTGCVALCHEISEICRLVVIVTPKHGAEDEIARGVNGLVWRPVIVAAGIVKMISRCVHENVTYNLALPVKNSDTYCSAPLGQARMSLPSPVAGAGGGV